MIAATAGTWVGFSVERHRYRMPLAVSFVLIGFFLWVAENAATYAGAWSYPQQLGGWRPVPLAQVRCLVLLISVTFVLVSTSGRPVQRRAEAPGTDGCPPPAPGVRFLQDRLTRRLAYGSRMTVHDSP